MAQAMNNTNEYVLEAEANGVPAIVLRADCPSDIQVWIKNNHNHFHLGSGVSYIETYDVVPQVEASWVEHRRKHNIVERNCPRSGPYRYEALYHDFVDSRFKGQFRNWDSFTAAKSFYRFASKWKTVSGKTLWEEFKAQAEDSTDFLDKTLETHVIHDLQNTISSTLSFFIDAMPGWLWEGIFLDMMLFTAPMERTVPGSHYYIPCCLLNLPRSVAKDRVRALKAPMAGSTVYRKAKASPQGSPSVTPATSPRHSPSRTGAATESTDVQSLAVVALNAEPQSRRTSGAGRQRFVETLSLDQATATSTRPKVWLDDLCRCLLAPLEKLNPQVLDQRSLIKLASFGIKFMLTATVQFNAKPFSTWSKLRKSLQQEAVKSHALSLTELPEVAGKVGANQGDAAQQILAILSSCDTPMEDFFRACGITLRSSFAFFGGAFFGALR